MDKKLLMIRASQFEPAVNLLKRLRRDNPGSRIDVLDRELLPWKSISSSDKPDHLVLLEPRGPYPYSLSVLPNHQRHRMKSCYDTVIVAVNPNSPCLFRLARLGFFLGKTVMFGTADDLRKLTCLDLIHYWSRSAIWSIRGLLEIFLQVLFRFLPAMVKVWNLARSPNTSTVPSFPRKEYQDGVTILIPSYNTRSLLTKCLERVSSLPSSPAVIVIDNGSSDGTAAMVREKFPTVELVALEQNVGFAGACNEGLKHVKTRYFCFLNSDVFLQTDIFPLVLQEFDKQNDLAAVTCRLLRTDGGVYRFLWTDSFLGINSLLFHSAVARYFGQTRWFRKRLGQLLLLDERTYETAREIDAFSFSLGIFRTSVLERTGGLDERFFLYFEDQDFCLRLRANGFRLKYLPVTAGVHVGQGSSPDTGTATTHWCTSRTLFLLKHRHYLASTLSVISNQP